jgi:integrase
MGNENSGSSTIFEMVFKKKEIDKLPLSAKGVTLFYRDTTEGSDLRLKIGVTKKSFYVNARRCVGKKNLINKIIPHDPKNYDLDDLRIEAKRLLSTLEPGELLEQKGDEFTVRQAFDVWKGVYGILSIKNENGKTADYYDDTFGVLNRYVPDWLDRDLREITEAEFLEKYSELAPLGISPARKVKVALSVLTVFAMKTRKDQGFHNFTSIISALNKDVPQKRNEYKITESDLGKFIRAALDLRDNPPEGMRSTNQLQHCINLHLLQLFTGMRPGELRNTPNDKVYTHKKSFVYDEEYALAVRKSGKAIEIPISDVAWTFVEREYNPANYMLFQSPTEPMKSIAETSAREYLKLIFDKAGLTRYPKKAMRNIFQQYCRLAEIPLHDWKALVDHVPKQKDVSVAYTYDDPNHLRKQAQKVTDLILEKTGLTKDLFGLKMEETNKFNALMKLLAEFSPEELKKLGISS